MHKVRGFTLIELLVTIVIVGIIIALALPSFRDLIERKHLAGAVEAAYEQLEFARSQAVKRSKPILVDFNVDGADWSIGVTDKMAGCDAEDASGDDAPCTVDYDNDTDTTDDNIIMRIHGGDYKNITMSQVTPFDDAGSNTCPGTPGDPANQVCFRFLRGLTDPGAYNFTSTNNTYTLQVQVSQLGRTNICVPSDKKYMAGYEECPEVVEAE